MNRGAAGKEGDVGGAGGREIGLGVLGGGCWPQAEIFETTSIAMQPNESATLAVDLSKNFPLGRKPAMHSAALWHNRCGAL